MIDPLEELRKKIEGYKVQLSDHLLAGGANSHENYMLSVGKAAAFEYVLTDIADIEKRYIEE